MPQALRIMSMITLGILYAAKRISAFQPIQLARGNRGFVSIYWPHNAFIGATAVGKRRRVRESQHVAPRLSNKPSSCHVPKQQQVSSWKRQMSSSDDSFPTSETPSNTSSSFLSTVYRSIENEILPLFQDQDHVVMVLGVSGGCDSVGLLHAMVQIRHPKLQLHVIHFDHRLRGTESDEDRIFVTNTCQALMVPLHVYYWDSEISFSQDSARSWRRSTMYQLLQSLTSQRGILATAHHKDDSTETLLLKLLRGVHITNIAGMDSVVKTDDTPQAIWARPLLKLSKADIQTFLFSQSLKWREDSSNASSKYKRNRVRNELMPLLVDIVGSEDLLEKRLENLSKQASELRADLTERAESYLQESGSDDRYFLLPVTGDFTLVHREALHSWATRNMKTSIFSFDQLQRVCAQLENHPNSFRWTLQIGQGLTIFRNGVSLELIIEHDCAVTSEPTLIKQSVPWTVVDAAEEIDEDDVLLIRIGKSADLEKLAFYLTSSDHVSRFPFLPAWRDKHVKVKDFLRGQKVPLHLRDKVPVITSFDDVVVAIQVKGKWEIDGEFIHKTDAQHESILLKLSPPK